MMDSPKRLFIGIPVTRSGELEDTVTSMRKAFTESKIRWVVTGQWHITLHFLGNVPSGLIQDISGEMKTTLQSVSSFSCRMKSIGVFKSIRQPSVVWCGLDPQPPFGNIYAKLYPVLSLVGHEKPQPRFTPHITLGRVKKIHDRRLLVTWLEKVQDTSFGTFSVDEVNLYESRLTPGGPVYRILYSVQLEK
jgi:RNA 2',3'-cyclic 3'-phosphodiesterase